MSEQQYEYYDVPEYPDFSIPVEINTENFDASRSIAAEDDPSFSPGFSPISTYDGTFRNLGDARVEFHSVDSFFYKPVLYIDYRVMVNDLLRFYGSGNYIAQSENPAFLWLRGDLGNGSFALECRFGHTNFGASPSTLAEAEQQLLSKMNGFADTDVQAGHFLSSIVGDDFSVTNIGARLIDPSLTNEARNLDLSPKQGYPKTARIGLKNSHSAQWMEFVVLDVIANPEYVRSAPVSFGNNPYLQDNMKVAYRWEYEPPKRPVGDGGGNGDDDGEPPDTTPTPKPVTPTSGGCKASLDGPSGCNWVVPPDAFPAPDGFPELPKPGDDFGSPPLDSPGFGDFPIEKMRMPDMPPLDCRMPDFGNSGPCAPFPGMGGSLPGGWDSKGNIGGSGGRGGGGVSVRTKGPTKDAREKKTFEKRACFPAGSSYMASITQLLVEAGISPLRIVFQITPEWDKQLRAEKCFAKGVRRWDAAAWFAEKLMCIIIDEGDGNVYIGPPFVRPGQKTHVFDEMVDLFAMDRVSDSQEAYYAVEVYRLESRVRGRRVPGFTKVAFVEPPFSVDPSSVLRIQVGPDYTESEAANLAALRAGQIRQNTAGIQVSVPFSEDYFLRDKMLIRAPRRGMQETYIIYGKESSLSAEGRVSILTGILPATAAILAQTPDLIPERVHPERDTEGR